MIRLQPHFLEDRVNSSTPFTVIDGCVYELYPTRTKTLPSSYLVFHGYTFQLEESETLNGRETKYLQNNSSALLTLAQSIVSKKVGALNTIRAEILALQSASLGVGSIGEKFVVDNSVKRFAQWHGAPAPSSFESRTSRVDSRWSLSDSPKFENLANQLSSMKLLQKTLGGDVLGWFGQLFSLTESPSESEFVCNNQKCFGFSHKSTLSQVARSYSSQLMQAIDESIDKNLPTYRAQLEEILALRSSITSRIPQNEVLCNHSGARFGIRRLLSNSEGNKYESYLILPKYILKKGAEAYLFEGVTLKSELQFSSRSMRILGKPQISGTGTYRHPFVFPNNQICFNGRINRFADEYVTFAPVALNAHDDYEKGAIMVAKNLETARRVLQEGYKGDYVSPVQSLTPANFNKEFQSASRNYDSKIPVFCN